MKNNIILIAVVTILSLAIIVTVILISTSGKEQNESESLPVISLTEEPQPPDEPSAEPSPPSDEPPVTSTPETSDISIPSDVFTDEPMPSAGAAEIVAMAHTLLGIDFVEGGETPSGFDNSGFIYYVLRENGYITCPRGVGQQAEMGTRLEYDSIKPGDLVFFYNESGTGAGFGGIYVGNGKMIACLMPGTVVREVDITGDYYRNNFYQGVSLSG